MKQIPTPVLLCASAAVAIFATILTNSISRTDENERLAYRGPESPELRVRLEEVTARLDQVEDRLAKLSELESRLAESSIPQVSESALAEQVRQLVLEMREGPAPEPPLSPFDLLAVLQELTHPDLDAATRAEIWAQLREEGQIDALLEEFERRAKERPNDSMAQTELGWARFQKMLAAKTGPERGKWGSRGAEALERALELDETNWDARFSLAQHYFYAEMRGDAIRNFETLIGQQDRSRPDEKHANAYLFLGNIHMNRGNEADARAVWEDGVRRFPSNELLKARLETLD